MLVARDKEIIIKIWIWPAWSRALSHFHHTAAKSRPPSKIETRTDPGAFTYAKNDRWQSFSSRLGQRNAWRCLADAQADAARPCRL